jgi:hypothetical protein
MAVTAQGSGTQTATVTTEHTLLDVAVAGVFSLHVDTINMVALDVLQLRIYQKILTGGVLRVVYTEEFIDAQDTDNLIKVSVPIANDLVEAASLRFTLKQSAGTSRTFPWKVLSY